MRAVFAASALEGAAPILWKVLVHVSPLRAHNADFGVLRVLCDERIF
jgi:hypothetical protein